MIEIIRARQHNLKEVTVSLPQGKLVVLTGPSGSGKSSLAFHTLYAEGQRRYVESLSTYARQFLDQIDKPDVDEIRGLSPAIAIEQGGRSPNPRSTVATVTEIYDYLRVLYATAGVPHEPSSGRRLERLSTDEIIERLMAQVEGSRLMILAPMESALAKDASRFSAEMQRQGFVRARFDGELFNLDECEAWPAKIGQLELIIDRLVIRDGIESRLADSIETARRICPDEVWVLLQAPEGQDWLEQRFPTRFIDPETGFVMADLTPRHFSFNSHLGACPHCHGLGTRLRPDPNLLVPDPSLSLLEGAVKTWWTKAPKRRLRQSESISTLAERFGVDPRAAFDSLPNDFHEALFWGIGEVAASLGFRGLCSEAEELHRSIKVESQRRRVAKFMSERPCEACKGRRLKAEILAVTLQGGSTSEVSIDQFCQLPVNQARDWLRGVNISPSRQVAVVRVLEELEKRLGFLEEVGLGYLSLDRASGTLSGGEAQRIRLATQLGGGLSGVIYVLDEPSIGLHPKDNKRLIAALKRLRDLGNTVVVVEHDEEMMRASDWIVDMGPGAGVHGGCVLAAGKPEELLGRADSPTGCWLAGHQSMPDLRCLTRDIDALPHLTLKGAREHNLKNLTLSIPLESMVVLVGPSGSGKSTLANNILRRELARRLNRSREVPGEFDRLEGAESLERLLVVDQSPLGRTPRSNPATYIGAFDHIRDLFAKLPLSRQRGYGPGRFSFNVSGGRCEKCQGGGTLKIDMHFLSDVYVRCDACEGRRYNRETLEVVYRGRNIADVLDMTAEEGLAFFEKVPKLQAILHALCEIGLGYLKLGQAANTLSGGEAQRVKLAAELSKSRAGKAFILLDEPTTGLHFSDVKVLLQALGRLREAGHSLLVIEHHPEVIRQADWLIELGPGGGEAGGKLIFEGTPEAMKQAAESVTGPFL